jgi:hypothetical protein
MAKKRKEIPKEINDMAKSLAKLVHEIDEKKGRKQQFEKNR